MKSIGSVSITRSLTLVNPFTHNRIIYGTMLATLAFVGPMVYAAQNSRPLQPNEHQLNIPGATTIEAPPAGFDPINASDEELQYHGFVPRPNQATQPQAYASWVRAMQHSKTRVVPSLEQTAIFHGPAKPVKLADPAGAASNAVLSLEPSNTQYSSNWSGYVNLSGAGSYGLTSFNYIGSDMVVPVAKQYGCDGGWDWGSEWNGIDGWHSADVLQAGVEFDAYCSGSYKSSYYSAWYEWYPYGEVRISSLPVTAGDDVFVSVWHSSPTQGYTYIVNYNTNQYVQIGFTADPAYPLIGNSEEWVVERPIVGGSLTNLTDYSFVPFWGLFSYTDGGVDYSLTTAFPVDMEVGTTLYSAVQSLGPYGFVAQYY